MNPHFFTALFTLLSFGLGFRVQGSGFKVQGSGFKVHGSGFKVHGSKGGGVAHFVILSGEKGRVLKNGLSENMRTESKDLSAAKYKNSLPLEGKVPRRGG